MSVQTLIQLRRGTAATWTSVNPTLSAGEFGYETDTGKYKIGDGTTAWTSLKYAVIVPDAFIGTSGVGLVKGTNNNNLTISVTGIYSSQMIDFISAVDARVAAGSVSSAQVMDIVGTGVIGGTGISVSYDTNAFDGQLTLNATGLAYSNHTHLLSNITDVTASATEVNYLDGTTLGTVTTGNVVAVDANKDISGFRDLSIDRNLVVGGNLTVNGTTTTVNSTTVDIGDNIIQVNVSGSATQGGLQVLDHDNSETHKFVWDIDNSRWEFSGPTSPDIYTSGNLSARVITATASPGTAPFVISSTNLVSNLNSDLLDSYHGSYYLDWTNTTNKPDPIITGVITGDVSGTGSVTLTDLANGTLTINTTLGANVVGSGNIINGTIIDEDINANANIAVTKLAAGSYGQVLQVNSSGSVIWGSIDGGTP